MTESSPNGSQSALLSAGGVKTKRQRWPKGKDFLFSTWAFVVGKVDFLFNFSIQSSSKFCFLGAHSLWELPVLTLRYGGVVFILVYLTVFLILGSPLLLLEMGLGQYSALSTSKLFRNMCPVITITNHLKKFL